MSSLRVIIMAETPLIEPINDDSAMTVEESTVIWVSSLNESVVIDRLCELQYTSEYDMRCSSYGTTTVLFDRNSCTLDDAIEEVRKVIGEVNVRPADRNLATTGPRPRI